jgi:hypothetical protein
MALKNRPRRIEIPGDMLVIDEDFCDEVLAGSSQRTARRFESQGLPFVMLGNCKYRPLKAGREWLAARIKHPNQPQRQRRRA